MTSVGFAWNLHGFAGYQQGQRISHMKSLMFSKKYMVGDVTTSLSIKFHKLQYKW
jgi:hypothetical protein